MIIKLLLFPFMDTCFWSCLTIAISASFLGPLLIAKKKVLYGDIIVHGTLFGVACAYIFFAGSVTLLMGAGIISSFSILAIVNFIKKYIDGHDDAYFMNIYFISFAAGLLLLNHYGSSEHLLHVLFGDDTKIEKSLVLILTFFMTFTLIVGAIFYRAIIIFSFDAFLSKKYKTQNTLLNMLFMFLLVLNTVGSLPVVGTLLSVGLMITPATVASIFSKNLQKQFIISFVVSFFSIYVGSIVAYNFNLSLGPVILLIIGLTFVYALIRNILYSDHKLKLSKIILRIVIVNSIILFITLINAKTYKINSISEVKNIKKKCCIHS